MERKQILENLPEINLKSNERLERLVDGTFKSNLPQALMFASSGCFFLAMESYFIEKNIPKAKDFLYLQGKLKLEGSKNHIAESSRRIFDVGRTLISNVGLSDNKNLIHSYSNHNYEIKYNSRGKDIVTDFNTWVEAGEDCIYNALLINALNKDIPKLEQNLNTFETITLKKTSNARMLLDLEFYKAFLSRDVAQITSVLLKFLSKKEHNYRNKHDLFPGLLSYPAVGYLKACHLNGMPIELEHELIPMQLITECNDIQYSDSFLKKLNLTYWLKNTAPLFAIALCSQLLVL